MPNGHEKNWVRLCHAIDGFRAVHRSWPTRVRLPEICLRDLRDELFTPESFAKLESRIRFVADGAEFVVEDDSGNTFSYAQQLRDMHEPDISASTWLGVAIDRPQSFY